MVVEEAVYVHNPRQGSAAAGAGLQRGDLVQAADGQEVMSYAALQGAVRSHESGQTVQLTVQRAASDRIEELALERP